MAGPWQPSSHEYGDVGTKWQPSTTPGITHWFWDGTELVECVLLGWWDGSAVQPCIVRGYWNGHNVRTMKGGGQ